MLLSRASLLHFSRTGNDGFLVLGMTAGVESWVCSQGCPGLSFCGGSLRPWGSPPGHFQGNFSRGWSKWGLPEREGVRALRVVLLVGWVGSGRWEFIFALLRRHGDAPSLSELSELLLSPCTDRDAPGAVASCQEVFAGQS